MGKYPGQRWVDKGGKSQRVRKTSRSSSSMSNAHRRRGSVTIKPTGTDHYKISGGGIEPVVVGSEERAEEVAEARRRLILKKNNLHARYEIGEEVKVDGKGKGRVTYIRFDPSGEEPPKYRVREEGSDNLHYMGSSRLSKA